MKKKLFWGLGVLLVLGSFLTFRTHVASGQSTAQGSAKSSVQQRAILTTAANRTSASSDVSAEKTQSPSATLTTATPTPTPQHVVDFDADGKTDFTIVRDNGGVSQTWYTLLNDGLGTNVRVQDWGLANPDFIEPGDYDGDHKTDYAIWRPPFNGDAAAFWILNSSNGTVTIIPFGLEGDDPSVIGDYDGDGRTDAAIFRPDFGSNKGIWWYLPTGGPRAGLQTAFSWGQATDYPLPGDFNADGKADFAVTQDDGTGQSIIWVHYGTGGYNPVASADRIDRFGLFSDTYVPGDYDGDGRTDYAIARNVGGSYQWWVQWSSDNSVHVANWGLSTDVIVQGDYDGDAKTDLAVWRRSDHTFYVLGSINGTPIFRNWGTSSVSDVPAANYNTH